MLEKPSEYIEKFAQSNPYMIAVHHESNDDIHKCLEMIRSLNIKAGITIKPKTDTAVLEQYIDKIDMIMIMSVEPGFGGQALWMVPLSAFKGSRNDWWSQHSFAGGRGNNRSNRKGGNQSRSRCVGGRLVYL